MVSDSEVRNIVCEKGVLEYRLTRKDVKNINLRVKPDGRILVSAKEGIPVKCIDDFIYKKYDYISRNQQKYRIQCDEISSFPKRYVSGEGINILGKCLRLKVMEGEKERVWTDGIFVFLSVNEKDNMKQKERLIKDWIENLQRDTFSEICGEVYQKFKKYGVLYPELKVRYMSSQWGSCQPKKGVITLNSRLIEAPRYCIEYVVLHEFVHFISPDHSRKFYNFMTMLMPDWEDRKAELERRMY